MDDDKIEGKEYRDQHVCGCYCIRNWWRSEGQFGDYGGKSYGPWEHVKCSGHSQPFGSEAYQQVDQKNREYEEKSRLESLERQVKEQKDKLISGKEKEIQKLEDRVQQLKGEGIAKIQEAGRLETEISKLKSEINRL